MMQKEFIDIKQPVLLSTLLQMQDGHFDMPCGGRGTCKKCKVTVTGSVSPVSPVEQQALSAQELAENVRLACQTYATGNVIVHYNSYSDNFQGITFGDMPEFLPSPMAEEGFGMAIDIGTTTIAAYLYDLQSLTCLEKYSEANKQGKFGADVISRIEYCNTNGLDAMTSCIREQIISIMQKFHKQIDVAVITGNTTMLHFLEGLDAGSIAVAPFTPKSLFGYRKELLNMDTYLPNCIASYVGADITCAVLASGMLDKPEKALLVDIGTNGEMALWDGEKFYCCSTAAGPAFEGAGISSGMPGTAGAVNTVRAEDGKILYTTIEDAAPRGICGSGIIDAVAVLVEKHIIDETGILLEEEHAYTDYVIEKDGELHFAIGDSGITLSQKDIRQVQLAKSAICAGVRTLLSECGSTVDTLYIAGGFGSFVNKENAGIMGLLPKELVDKTKVIGNGAGTGACMLLLNTGFCDTCETIAKTAQVVELSTNPTFMDQYIECMMFE